MAPKTRKGIATSKRIAKAIKAVQLRASARLKPVEAAEGEAEAEGPKKMQVSKKKPQKRTRPSGTGASSVTSGESSRSIKKKAREEKAAKDKAVMAKQLEENKTGGLQLLKRKMVTMSSVDQRMTRGIKLKVEITAKGEPFGKVAGEMQSYIGVLARTTIPIDAKEWRLASADAKKKIWESVEVYRIFTWPFYI